MEILELTGPNVTDALEIILVASLSKEKTKPPLETHRFGEQHRKRFVAPENVICNRMSKILEQENKKTRLAGSQWRIPRSF